MSGTLSNDESLLSSLVDNDGLSTLEKENTILLPLLEEIDLIKNKEIRLFTRAALLSAELFWTANAGHNYELMPEDTKSKGGNIVHTKRVSRIASLLCSAHGQSLNILTPEWTHEEVRDMVISAALLHCLTKAAYIHEGIIIYDKFYPYTLSDLIEQLRKEDKFSNDQESSTLHLDEAVQEFILSLVRSHLGDWSPVPETRPTNVPAMVLHSAYFIAINMDWIVGFEDLKEFQCLENMD